MREQYWDAERWGFFDTAPGTARTGRVPFLETPVKAIQDSPTASANGCAAQFYEKLWRLTEVESYRKTAEETLHAFSRLAGQLGLFGSAYFLGLDMYLDPPPVAVIVGPASSFETKKLRDSLVRIPRWGAAIIAYDPKAHDAASLPAAVRAMLDRYDPKTGQVAYICSGTSCHPPTSDVDEAVALLRQAGKKA